MHTTLRRYASELTISLAVLVCAFLASGELFAQAVGQNEVESRRAQLQQELAEIEREIEAQQVLLQDKQRERVSLERDIAILDAQIEKARLSIRARDLEIERLGQDIRGKETTIGDLSDKLDRERESLAQLLRRTNEIDDYSIAEIALSSQNISAFFSDLDSFDSIKEALQGSFVEIEMTKASTQEEKEQLEDKRSQEVELRHLQELERQKIAKQEQEKQQILKATKGVEAEYQKVILAKEKSAAEIRTELFTLRGSSAIPFEKALEYANYASSKTGVRPAVILGVIAEESNLGENVGTGNWMTDMHPTRDRPVFQEICSRLGLDPDKMPVSKKPWYGWGGAMGPAQFIPSTWVLYEDRIAKLAGQEPPSPWDPKTAFVATALLMMDNGADRGTYAAERLAALRYFAGWKNAEKPSYAFYGDEVMALAEKYQRQIDILAASN
jgi:peptidoglycan hydrolase CwlO-like protein